MNITGEHSSYIRNLIFTFTSVNSTDIRGIIYDGTLYFIVNFGVLYVIRLDNIPRELICCFQRNSDKPNSFKDENMITDIPLLFNDVYSRISKTLSYISGPLIFEDNDCLENTQIEEIQKLRAGDGSIKYYINPSSSDHRSFVMLCKQMIKVNKGDKLSMRAYGVEQDRILYNFTIFKKKFGLDVNIFLLTLDVHSNYGR